MRYEHKATIKMRALGNNQLSLKRIAVKIVSHNIYQISARLFLGILFIYASLDKIAFPKEFSEIVISYNLLPKSLAIHFAFILPWLEIVAGTLLIMGVYIRRASIFVSILLITFIIALVFRTINGSIGNCGCFSVKSTSYTDHYLLIAKDIFLLLLGISLFYKKGQLIPRQGKEAR
jgi:uncharacterized membrane protein YphA (DoxX/SURF4 family)